MFKKKYDEAKKNKKRNKLKRLAEKRREKRKRNNQPEVMKSIFGDKDPRTRKHGRHTLFYIVFVTIFCLSVFMIVKGGIQWRHDTLMNTSKINSSYEFPLSKTSIKLGDVYTDKNRELTVVRLIYNKKADKNLPTNGKDYDVMIKSMDKKNLKAFYGRLFPNGDGYLFIKGNMGDQPFQVGLRNKILINTGDNNSDIDNNGNIKDIKTKRDMVDSITGKSVRDANKDGIANIFKDTTEPPKWDAIDFRINAYSDTTSIYKGSFLKKDGSIDYGKVVQQMNTESKVKEFDKEIEILNSKIKGYDKSIKSRKDDLKRDKKNKNYRSYLREIEEKKKDDEEQMRKLKVLKQQHESFDFGKSDFEISSNPKDTIYRKLEK